MFSLISLSDVPGRIRPRSPTSVNNLWALLCASNRPGMRASASCSMAQESTVNCLWSKDRSILRRKERPKLRSSAAVVRDQDSLAEQMILSGPDYHRATGVRLHVQLVDAQRVEREGVAMRRVPFVRARAVIGVRTEIGAALRRARGQRRTVFLTGSLGQRGDIPRQVIDHPMPPSRGIAVLIGIEQSQHETFGSRRNAGPL